MNEKEQKQQESGNLLKGLEPYNDYFLEGCDNDAKTALEEFFKKYQNIPTDTTYEAGNWNSYFSYYDDILAIRKALQEKRYANVCNEIISLNARQPMRQKRVYDSLMGLYHEYLEGEKSNG